MPFTMTFGRHKGKPLTEVPQKDLEYYSAWDQIRPEQKSEIDKELARRRGGDGPATGHGRPAATQNGGSSSAPSAITARARDIVAMGAEALKPCAITNEALAWLIELLDGSIAPDSVVPF